ncbi:Xaa-pro dipeptidase [Globisporangium polare]
MASRDDIKGLLSVTAAAAAAASIALFQKTRAPAYSQAHHASKKPSAAHKTHDHAHEHGANGHSHHIHSLQTDSANGYELFPIDYGMHAQHRRNAMKKFTAAFPEAKTNASAILLHGGVEVDRYDTDTQYAFRQESFFQYLFGVREPGCAGFLDLKTHKSVLLVPRLSAEWELWCGDRKPLAYFKNHYKVDEVYYVDELLAVLKEKHAVQHLYLLEGVNNDSGLTTTTTSTFEGIEQFTANLTDLHRVLVECRYIKSEKELELMRFVNNLSSQAHIQVMKSIRPGKMEFHAESYFLHHCYSQGGARLHAYTCICGSGHNASALHYGHAGAPNDKILDDGDIFLCDMGAELHGYSSDITCTFPVNGKFTPDQRMIYEGVLKAHDAVLAAIKPGVSNVDMHLLSHRVLTQHLLEHGLFQNGTVDELMDHEISAYFYPHGLGHVLGLDVHDVGGFPVGHKRSEKKILQKLRYVRTLEKNVVFTVEPGCYFIEAQIQDVLSNPATAKFINQEMLARFRGTGGVRIESDVIVTAHGVENMTKVPRTVEDIEAVMNAK